MVDIDPSHVHAPPVDLNNPSAQADPTANGSEINTSIGVGGLPQTEQEYYNTPEDRAPRDNSSPEPFEVIFAQIRDDLQRNERLLMLTTTIAVLMGLLFAYYVRKGRFLEIVE